MIEFFDIYRHPNRSLLSGLEARDMFARTGIPQATLAHIWSLADVDGDGSLTREEFAVAMYFVDSVRFDVYRCV